MMVFTPEQQKLIVDLFADLDTSYSRYGSNGEIIEKKVEKDSRWFPDLEELLPIVSEVLTEDPSKIKLLDPLLKYYNFKTYSSAKSKKVILEALDELATRFDFDIIPLFYTTKLLPERKAGPISTWGTVLALKCFREEDYGHVDFVNTLLELQEEGVIKIKQFGVPFLDPESIVLEATLEYSPKELSPVEKAELFRGNKSLEAKAGDFSYYNDGTVYYKEEALEMRGQIQVLARLFIDRKNELLTIDDIREQIIHSKRRADTSNATLAKYVAELRKIFKKASGKDALVNVKKEGWKFLP